MDDFFSALNLTGALAWPDLIIVGGAVALVFVIAYLSGRRQQDTQDFFLGQRRVPALVACLAFVATEISAVTIVAVPAESYARKWEYLQFFIGSAAARILVAFLFLPVFYRYNCTTIYEFLKHRFGDQTRYAGSIFFFITRLMGSGVRLYATALPLAIILGWSLAQTIVVFVAVGIVFIAFGGVKAVVWTGAYETLVFYLAGGAVSVYLIGQIEGGLWGIWQVAGQAGKMEVFNFNSSLADPNTLWAATICALFLNMSVFGTDQDFVQRMLTVKTRRASQRAMIGTIAAALPLVCMYVGLGTLMFVYLGQHAELPAPDNQDQILSLFVVNVLPTGLKGLVVAAIILASIDSPLSSLSSSFVTDIYRPLLRRHAGERHYLWVSRLGVVGFGLILGALAFCCQSLVGILWAAFKVVAITGGSSLGVFLLGILTRRRANRGNVVAMTVSAVGCGLLLYLVESKRLALGWSWIIVIGTISTFVIGWLLGRKPPAEANSS